MTNLILNFQLLAIYTNIFMNDVHQYELILRVFSIDTRKKTYGKLSVEFLIVSY